MEEPYRLDDALFALQSLIEYVNALPSLAPTLRKHDWTLYECMDAARKYREYTA